MSDPVTAPARRPHLAVVGLACVTALVAVGVGALTFPMRGDATAAHAPFWWSIALAVSFLVERFPIRVHFRSEAHVVVLSEIPVVVGLFFLSPLELVAARVGGGLLYLLLADRQRLLKLGLNASVYLGETVAAIALFELTRRGMTVNGWNLGAALFSSSAGTLIGAFVVWRAIAFVNREVIWSAFWTTLRFSLPASIANASIGLAAVAIITYQPSAVWILIPPAAVLIGGYQLYVREREHRQTLTMLYDLARETHSAPDSGMALQRLTDAVREHARAVAVELYVVRGSGPATVVVSADDTDGAGRSLVDDVPADVHAAVRTEGPLRTMDASGRCTALTYGIEVGRGRHAVFRLREPLSEAEGFAGPTLSILSAGATHATALIEDAEVHDAKNAFLSAVSHELRTPLAIVLGSSETLQRLGDQLDPGQRVALTSRLHAQAQKLDRLLHDLLDVDRLNRGIVGTRATPTDLGTLIENTVSALDVTSHAVVLRGAPVTVPIDGSQIERVVENLVQNAVKYSPRGTTITVNVTPHDDGARIAVEDEGPGIPDDDKDRIFEAFLRLDRNHPSPGTGVGLSLVRRFVDLHGGSVLVEDVVPTGARFIVDLPGSGGAGHAPDDEEHDPPRPDLRLVSGD